MTEIQLKKRFCIIDLLKRAWKITSDNLGKIILFELFLLLLFIVLFIPIFLIYPDNPEAEPEKSLIANALSILLQLAFGLGVSNIALRFSNHETVNLSHFFSKLGRYWTYLLAALLFWLAFSVGLVLFIIPGIILAIRFSLYNYVILDQNLGAIGSLEKSWEIVKGVTWKVFRFTLALILINLLGALMLGIGLLITFPVTLIAQALLYRTLWNQTNVTVLADETPTELPR